MIPWRGTRASWRRGSSSAADPGERPAAGRQAAAPVRRQAAAPVRRQAAAPVRRVITPMTSGALDGGRAGGRVSETAVQMRSRTFTELPVRTDDTLHAWSCADREAICRLICLPGQA